MKTIFLILLALTIQAKAIQIQANPPQPDSTVLTPFDALTGETLKGQSLSIDFVFDPLTMLPDHLFIALTLFTDCPKDLTLANQWLTKRNESTTFWKSVIARRIGFNFVS